MNGIDLWLTANLGPLDAAWPVWLPWVALGLVLVLLGLVLMLRRGAALAEALARAEAERTAAAEVLARLHARDIELARSLVGNESASQTTARLESALAAATEQTERLRAEHDRRLAEAIHRAETAEREVAALQAQADAADQTVARLESAVAAATEQAAHLRADHDRRLTETAQRAETAERELAALRAQTDQERRAAEEKLAMITAMRDDLRRSFKELADAALQESGEQLSKSSRERLEAALTPLKEHVTLFQAELKASHESALREREALKQEILMLSRRSEDVSKEAVALTRALKGDKQRQGAWGEMVLEGILERSGLRKGEEYTTQDSHQGDEGARLRSDVIVRMPQGSALVIDSKVSLVDYETSVNSEDDTQAALARKRHVRALQAHIDTLSGKDYARLIGQSVDYTIMFVPIEGALSEALREDGDLTRYALEKSVMIATPTTLMLALRTIANFWTFDRRNRNAEEIARRAGLLYEKVALFAESMEGVGKSLSQAQTSYSTAMDRLSRGNGNVLSQVDRLKQLGARTSKSIATDFDPEPEAAPLPAPREGERGADET